MTDQHYRSNELAELHAKLNELSAQILSNRSLILENRAAISEHSSEISPRQNFEVTEPRGSIVTPIDVLAELEESGVHGITLIKKSEERYVRRFWTAAIAVLFAVTAAQTCVQINQSFNSPTAVSIYFSDAWPLLAADFMIVDPISGFTNLTGFHMHCSNGSGVWSGEERGNGTHNATLSQLFMLYYVLGWNELMLNLQQSRGVECVDVASIEFLANRKYLYNASNGAQLLFDFLNEHLTNKILKVDDIFESCSVGNDSISCEQIVSPIMTTEFGVAFVFKMSKFSDTVKRLHSMGMGFVHAHLKAHWNKDIYHIPGQGPLMLVPGTNQLNNGHNFSQFGVHLKPNAHVNLFVSATKTKRLKTSSHKCFDSEEIKERTKRFTSYDVNQCIQINYYWDFETQYNCSRFLTTVLKHDYISSLWNASSSSPPPLRGNLCPDTEFESFIANRHVQKNRNVAHHLGCLQPCDTDQYDYRHVNTDNYYDLKTNHTSFNINLAQDQYPVFVENVALEWYEYLGLIGGAWGLWLGCSIMTIVQLLAKMTHMIIASCRKYFAVQKREHTESSCSA